MWKRNTMQQIINLLQWHGCRCFLTWRVAVSVLGSSCPSTLAISCFEHDDIVGSFALFDAIEAGLIRNCSATRDVRHGCFMRLDSWNMHKYIVTHVVGFDKAVSVCISDHCQTLILKFWLQHIQQLFTELFSFTIFTHHCFHFTFSLATLSSCVLIYT